jgi:hypothetical protein
MKMDQSVPKRRQLKFRRRGITQKKAYNKCFITFLLRENMFCDTLLLIYKRAMEGFEMAGRHVPSYVVMMSLWGTSELSFVELGTLPCVDTN